MKLDVEGYEPSVINGARAFLRKHAPAAILTEYTPGVQERARAWARLPEYPRSLRILAEAGYSIWHLVGTGKNAEVVLNWPWESAKLPPLAELTDDGLRAEELNAHNMLMDQVGGPMRGAPGFAIPWDLHPKSLHAEFSHNTDLLLTRKKDVGDIIRRRRIVGVAHDTNFGLGGGMCVHVLRDGTAMEMVGRLCVQRGRNESIARSIAMAERPRPIRFRQTWHASVGAEASNWRMEGPMRSSKRTLVWVGKDEAAAGGGGRGGGGRSGRGRGGPVGRGRGGRRWKRGPPQ